MQAGLHGASTTAERDGHLCLAEPVVVPEHDGRPLLGTEGLNRRPYCLSEFRFLRYEVGGWVGRGQVCGGLFQRQAAVVSSSQLLEADVDDDPVQPGGKGPFRIEPLYRGEQIHEDLLRDVLGEVVVPDDSIRGAQYGQPVKLEENFQPRQVSVPTLKYGLPLP